MRWDLFSKLFAKLCADLHTYLQKTAQMSNSHLLVQILHKSSGASLEHIESFCQHYASQLEVKGCPTNMRDDAKTFGSLESIEDLLGKRTQFYKILDHYKKLLLKTYEGNLEEMVAEEFAKLNKGIGMD